MININDYRTGLLNYDNLPTIDLHGEIGDIAKVKVKDFINENYKLKNKFFSVIHGVSGGIVKKATINVLNHNKKVINYGLVIRNPGCTIVEIDIERPS